MSRYQHGPIVCEQFLSMIGYPWETKSSEIEIWAFPYQDANMLIDHKDDW